MKILYKFFDTEPMQKIRGSLPDLRHDCYCPRRYCGRNAAIYRLHESSGSTDSLLDEAEEFLRHDSSSGNLTKRASRRCSEADVQRGDDKKMIAKSIKQNNNFFHLQQIFIPRSIHCLSFQRRQNA